MTRRVSSEVFFDRIQALVTRDGQQAVEAFYMSGRGNRPAVSQQTVQRWIRGETMPQNAYCNRSVSERGRVMTGNVIQGRFAAGTIVDGVNVGGRLDPSRSLNSRAMTQAFRIGVERRQTNREGRRTHIESGLATASQRASFEEEESRWDESQNAYYDAILDWQEYYDYLREHGEDDLHSWDDWREIYGAVSG